MSDQQPDQPTETPVPTVPDRTPAEQQQPTPVADPLSGTDPDGVDDQDDDD